MFDTAGQRQFLLLGSGEFLPWSEEAERYVLATARPGPIAILPTASAREGDHVFDRWASLGLDHYAQLGLTARVVGLKSRDDAERRDLIAAIDAASMIFFSGGNPVHLAQTLDRTPFLDAVVRAVAGGAVFAGCSAGATIAGARMTRTPALGIRSPGLGLVDHVGFGVHWNRVPSLPGVKRFMTASTDPGDAVIGIDEMTAIAGDGIRWRVFGAGRAEMRRDGRSVSFRAGDEFSLD